MPGASRVMVNMPASLFPLPAPSTCLLGHSPDLGFYRQPQAGGEGQNRLDTWSSTGQTPTRCAQAASLCTRFASAL